MEHMPVCLEKTVALCPPLLLSFLVGKLVQADLTESLDIFPQTKSISSSLPIERTLLAIRARSLGTL